MSEKPITVAEMARMGRVARAKAHSKAQLRAWGKLGGREPGSSKLAARQYLESLLHLARLAVGTQQLFGWVRYSWVARLGALIDVGLFGVLVQHEGWRAYGALPVAIEAATLSNGSVMFQGTGP
jgi:hypothetical protein